MDSLGAILTIINCAGDKKIGRTALQKLAYFASEKRLVEFYFFPYYYGPYSEQVLETLADLVSLDFVNEEVESDRTLPHRWKKYRYSLTNDGKNLVKYLIKEYKAEYEGINHVVTLARQHTDFNTQILSVAAKTHFIIAGKKKAMTVKEIAKEAKTLEWSVQPIEMQQAINLLENLDLVT